MFWLRQSLSDDQCMTHMMIDSNDNYNAMLGNIHEFSEGMGPKEMFKIWCGLNPCYKQLPFSCKLHLPLSYFKLRCFSKIDILVFSQGLQLLRQLFVLCAKACIDIFQCFNWGLNPQQLAPED